MRDKQLMGLIRNNLLNYWLTKTFFLSRLSVMWGTERIQNGTPGPHSLTFTLLTFSFSYLILLFPCATPDDLHSTSLSEKHLSELVLKYYLVVFAILLIYVWLRKHYYEDTTARWDYSPGAMSYRKSYGCIIFG